MGAKHDVPLRGHLGQICFIAKVWVEGEGGPGTVQTEKEGISHAETSFRRVTGADTNPVISF